MSRHSDRSHPAPGEYELTVSVLIPVLNEEAHLPAMAEAALSQRGVDLVEFLFIDGGSSDGSRAILSALASADPRVRVLENPARRTPHALNIGLRASRGLYIARMDAHTLYPQQYLATGIKRLQAGDVEWASGPQLAYGTSIGSRLVARALSTPLGRGGARFRDQMATEHETDTGFTGIWRRETLEQLGGWAEEWVNDQDVELAARVRKRGGRIVCVPEMAARYVPRGTPRALARQYTTYGMYRVKTAQRHPETMRRSQLLPPTLAATALVAASGRYRISRAAQAGLGAYAVALVAAATRAARDERPLDAAALPVIWATMHLSYGFGFLRGCVRFGPPLRSLRRLLQTGQAPT
jgi:succinoglycan biosynthesis protein ExoA